MSGLIGSLLSTARALNAQTQGVNTAGKNMANPIAAILSGALMLDHLDETEAAERVRAACAANVDRSGSTSEIGAAIVTELTGAGS